MRKAVILSTVALLVPGITFASCSSNGTTLVYVNGIMTSYSDAQHDLSQLEKLLDQDGLTDIYFTNGYNPVHLDGLGDELESITQAFNSPISDYDLDTILTQMAPEVTTRKVLLVGHSQGTFYTNEMYDYLVQNGVPPESIGVYNIATPAGSVAGGGTYLTSANDKVINYVRELDAEAGAPEALPANVIVPEEAGYAANAWAGHFPDVYMDGAPDRIVSDLQHALGKLSSSDTDTSGSCFAPPPLGLSYDAQKALFSVADPAVASVDYATVDARNTVASVMDNTNDIIHSALADAYFSVVPEPDAQNAAGVFAVEKALYGSSLSVADYEALTNGEDIPDDAPAPQTQEVAAKPEPQPIQSIPAEPPQVKPVGENEDTQPTPQATSATRALIPISPGFGGGASPVAANVAVPVPVVGDTNTSTSPQDQSVDPITSTSSTTTIPVENDVPAATTTLSFSVLSPADQTTFSTSSIAFSGTTSPDALVFAMLNATTSSTTADESGGWSLQLDLPAGTTTVALSAADPSGDYSATTTLTIGVAIPVQIADSVSPVTDTFDPGFSGWNNYAPTWTTSSWDTTTTDCYAGNCVLENEFDQTYENIKYGTPLDAGSFVMYFRNDGYSGGFGAGVCSAATSSQCQSPLSIGGTDALIMTRLNDYRDNIWHYLYFAFQDGSAGKEYCGMVDDDTSADCAWKTTPIPSGTTYSGVLFFTESGLNRGASFYWDELGTGTYMPTGP